MPRSKNPHILVIRLSSMGDVAMTVPVLLALLQTYPELRLSVLTKPSFSPIFKVLERVRVIPADVRGRHKGVVGLWNLYKTLRKERVDAVADLHNVLRSKILKLFFSSSKIPFVQLDKGRAEKKALTSRRNKVFEPLLSTHERYANVFGKLGYPINLKKVELLPRQPLPEAMRHRIGNDRRKWIGIAPFAAFPGKQYPIHLMETVLREIESTEKYKIFLFGGGLEEERQLAAWALKFRACFNVAGTGGLDEELALISNLDLMVSMDSGNAHLASNYGIPTLTLWGVTHPYTGFYPFGQNADLAFLADRTLYPGIPTSIYGKYVPAGYEKAMETIAPETVVKKIVEITSGH